MGFIGDSPCPKFFITGKIEVEREIKEENIQLSLKEHIRPSLQFLNAVGGGVVLDCLDEDEIADMLIDNIYGIIQGDKQGMEIAVESEEYEDMDIDGEETSEEEISEDSVQDEYVVIGQKVKVRVKETDELKTILVNYLPNSTKIPPLAKSLIGCHIGDEVLFQGKIYLLEEIQK